MSNNFSPSIIPQAGLAPSNGSNQQGSFTKTETAPTVRKIPGMTAYNPETGVVEDTGVSWGNKDAADKAEKAKNTKVKAKPAEETTETEADRHQKWKETQAAKKEASQQSKNQKAVEKQALAKDYLAQGNLTKAAEALGMSPTDLMLSMQNAALGIQTKGKELTAEEKKAADAAKYQQSVDAELAESRKFRYETTAANWARENIAPVMADKEKYELLNRDTALIPKIQRTVYDFLNKKYQDTCQYDSDGKIIKEGEILKVEDVLNSMEEMYENSMKEALDKAKQVKKFSKYFTAEEQEEKAAKTKAEPEEEERQLGDEVDETTEFAKNLPTQQEEANEEVNPRLVARAISGVSTNSKTPFAFLSPEDKVKRFREQEALAAKKAKRK